MKRITASIAIAVFQFSLAQAQRAENRDRAYPPDMPGAISETYKTVGDTQLKLYIFNPEGWQASDKRPAIVFFFGGGWTNGSPRQFLEQCKYLASRGMVAIAADYRVASRNQVKAVDCAKDAKSAIRFVRKNAARLGVDPQRIAAGGGSAGGHLAAACGTITGFEEPDEDGAISSRPDALLLFNPAVVLAPIEGINADDRRLAPLEERLGVNPSDLSPYHHIAAGAPPTAIFHGTADQVVPHATVIAFAKAMKDAGNRCELFSYDDQGHGFFNYGRAGNKLYTATLREADKFLASLGYLQGEPTLDAPQANAGDTPSAPKE